mmetsp:Transcript_11455/g.27880  ORF Transcript_11455/g.27880 Transcript_11455/m.27880 type:complete len:241 (-) Transcript_11455:11-733(-)
MVPRDPKHQSLGGSDFLRLRNVDFSDAKRSLDLRGVGEDTRMRRALVVQAHPCVHHLALLVNHHTAAVGGDVAREALGDIQIVQELSEVESADVLLRHFVLHVGEALDADVVAPGAHSERCILRDAKYGDAILLGDGLERPQLAPAPAVLVAGERSREEGKDHLLALEGAEGGLFEAGAHQGEVGSSIADRDSLSRDGGVPSGARLDGAGARESGRAGDAERGGKSEGGHLGGWWGKLGQ